MTRLECTVTNCLHNAENRCCKQAIVVDGSEAQDNYETCCGSFDQNLEGSYRNLFKTPENRLEIDCEAINCVYNSDRRCGAERIGIVGDGASEPGHTECATFTLR